MKEVIEVLAAVISFVSLLVAYHAYRRATLAERRSLAETKTNVFLTFRQRFQEIKNNLPPRWRDPHWFPYLDTDEWRAIEHYWQNAFDEWYVPVRLNPDHLQELWTVFFESAIQSALENRPLRYMAWALYERREFAVHRDEFAKVLTRLHGKPLKDEDFPEPQVAPEADPTRTFEFGIS